MLHFLRSCLFVFVVAPPILSFLSTYSLKINSLLFDPPRISRTQTAALDRSSRSCEEGDRIKGVVGRGRGRRRPPLFSTGDASPTPLTFWTEIRAKVSPLLQLVTY